MPDVTQPRFNIPDVFWLALQSVGLEPSVVLRQARLPMTLHIRERRDRRQVTTLSSFACGRRCAYLILIRLSGYYW